MTSLLLMWTLFGQITPTEDILKTFYLRDATSLTETITTLRKQLNLRYMVINTGVTGISIRDTPERIGQAENLLAPFARESSPALAVNSDSQADEAHIVQTFYLSDSSTQLDLVEIVTALRALLNTHYVATNKNAKAITIRDTRSQAALAGKVIADLDRSRPTSAVQASTIIDAGKASDWDRRDVGGTQRQISLRNVQSEEGIIEIVGALRTLLNNALVEAKGSTIILRDSANNLLIAERIVADLDKPTRR